MSSRPIARWIAAAAVLLLGAVAALRLPLAYQPGRSFPELDVALRLAAGADAGALTRRWVVPLESAIRAAGGVRDVAGEVDGRGARFTVRLGPGANAERKAARLESELGALRRRLPPGSSLTVSPAGQGAGDLSLIAWLPGSPGRAFEQAIRDLPEVKDVLLAGERREEVRIVPRGHGDPGALAAALGSELAAADLGHATAGGRRLPVWVRGAAGVPFPEQRLRWGRSVVPLASVAVLELTAEEAPRLAHYQGRRGLVLLVERELDASPLALERALKRVFERFDLGDQVRVVVDEAEPLKRLLGRSLLGLGLASLALAIGAGLVAGWRAAAGYGAALPVAAAAALNAVALSGLGLDVTTLPAIAVALAGGLFFLALRHGGAGAAAAVTTVAAGLLLPIAVVLASGRLAPLLAAPARAFAASLTAAVVALLILPLPPLAALPRSRVRRALKAVLRHPGTVALLVVTATYFLIVLSARALSPRPGSLSPALADFAVTLRFPPGTTVPQAEAQVSAIEAHLDGLEPVAEHWSTFSRFEGSIGVRLRPRDRRLDRLRPLVRRLGAELAVLGAAARVLPLAAGGRRDEQPLRFSDDLKDRPETDDEAMTYRLLLKSTDLAALRLAHARVVDRLAKMNQHLWPELIRSEWVEPAERLELVPRAGVSRRAVARARQAFRRLSFPPARPLAAGRDLRLRVMDPQGPKAADEVPLRQDLEGLLAADGRPLSTAALFALRRAEGSPSVRRQGGRFVLPVAVRIRGEALGLRRNRRAQIHHQLHVLPLPAGVDLVRPEINPFYWGPERLRMLAVAGALPLLVLALAVSRLNSFLAGFAALAPLALGVLAATPWILTVKGHVDEMTLLGLAAAVVAGLPLVVEIAAALRSRGGTTLADGAAYRWLARRAPVTAAATVGAVVLLAVPGLGLEVDRFPWVLPLEAAAVTAAGIFLAGFTLLPVLLLAAGRWRRRDRAREGWRKNPRRWRAVGELELSARNLTKVYGNGFVGLHSVRFRLGPGITGLLGPNGAGKTTLLRLLCGLLEATRGQVRFRGVPITPDNLPGYRRLVGFLPQGFNAYEGFTAEQFLDYWALEKGIRERRLRQREIGELLERVGLEEARGRKVRDLSGGMRRRIGIARALLGDPQIVIVDEPTTGLDVESRHRLRRSLLAAAGERIILFSTHIASDIAAAAARILVLDGGRLRYDGSAGGLIELARGRVFETLVGDRELRDLSRSYRLTTRVRTMEGIRVRAVTWDGQEPAGELVEPNLEEAYLAMIGKPTARVGEARRPGSLLDLDVWRS